MATMGGAINPSREEFLVISTEKLICRIEEAEEQASQQRRRLDQWLTREQKTLAEEQEQKQYETWLEVKSTQQEQDTIHDAIVQRTQVATKEANQERWGRIKDVHEQWGNNQKNAEMRKNVTAAIHLGVAWKSGLMSRDPVDITYQRVRHGSFVFRKVTPKEAQRLDQTDQDKTEDAVMTPQLSQEQEQDKTENAVITPHPNQEQDKTEETVVHKEAQQTLQTMEDATMPKKTQCTNQMEQDRPEETEMQRLYAEVQKTDTEAEISMAIMLKAQSEEQEHNIEFKTGQQGQDTEFQHQQQATSGNEVKRVVKLDKAGNIARDREGQEILNKRPEETTDKYVKEGPSEEAKRNSHLLRHWECTTRSEEMELRKQEIELQKEEAQLRKHEIEMRQEQDKHEIAMQERKNRLEMQQDEHKRRMNSTLW
jgi:hypothetical protein